MVKSNFLSKEPSANLIGTYEQVSNSICIPKKRAQKKSCCLQLSTNNPIRYPDPAIYSQEEQISLGNIPSWDNPDITTNEWATLRLFPETQVVIHNLSPNTSSINTLIYFSTSTFGIGMQQTLQTIKLVNLQPSSSIVINFPLPQAVLAGDQRIGAFIKIEHPTDANYANNSGSQVIDCSYTTESGRKFTLAIPVLNNSNNPRQFLFNILPTDLTASLDFSSHNFAPFEQFIITLYIEVPVFLTGTVANYIDRAVSVVARSTEGELIGGITKVLRINN